MRGASALPPPLSGIQPPRTPFSNTSKPVLADLKQAGFLAREVVAFFRVRSWGAVGTIYLPPL